MPKQPRSRSLSGKFSPKAPYTPADFKAYRRPTYPRATHDGSLCLHPAAEPVPIGRIRRGIWEVRQGGKYQGVIYSIFQHTFGPLEDGERLHRICKTKGCLNEDHYTIQKRKLNMSLNNAMKLFMAASQGTEVRIPLASKSEAARLRFRLYAYRKRLKNSHPIFYNNTKNVILSIEETTIVAHSLGDDLEQVLEDAVKDIDLPPMDYPTKAVPLPETPSAFDPMEDFLKKKYSAEGAESPEKVGDAKDGDGDEK